MLKYGSDESLKHMVKTVSVFAKQRIVGLDMQDGHRPVHSDCNVSLSLGGKWVFIDFGHEVTSVSFTPEQAEDIGNMLIEMARRAREEK